MKQKICLKCNAKVADNLSLCSNCGAEQTKENASMSQNQPTNKSQKSSNNNQMKIKFQEKTDNTNINGILLRPGGMLLISTYEILFGAFLFFSGIFVILYANSSSVQASSALGGISSSEIFVLGGIIVLWGVLGIAGAILFLKWKNIGFILSILFMISTGLILFAFYFIPLVSMFLALVYFVFNKHFKDTWNSMKS